MNSRPGIQEYYATLVRLVANQMVDPHRYFEQKLVGEMRASRDAAARDALLSQLLQWLDDGLLTEAQRERVDAQLSQAGMPDTRAVAQLPHALRNVDAGQ